MATEKLPINNAQVATNSSHIDTLGIRNLAVHAGQVYSSGQPSGDQLKALADNGIKHIINLRGKNEQDNDEGELVRGLGMSYHSVEISSVDDVNAENAGKLALLIKQLEGDGVLVHCASSNRVGALVAITAHQQGLDIEDAVNKGKRWGLKSLEPAVRNVIGTNNKNN